MTDNELNHPEDHTQNDQSSQTNLPVTRFWGEYLVLQDESTHKVKMITVNPGGRLSYQYHHHRSETWVIVKGNAEVTINGITSLVLPGESIYIKQGDHHRVCNSSEVPLIFIEVQHGTYFGEDDIVRIEDDYGRA